MIAISTEAKKILAEIIQHEKEPNYWEKRFKNISPKNEAILRGCFEELKNANMVITKWADDAPDEIFILKDGYLFEEKCKQISCEGSFLSDNEYQYIKEIEMKIGNSKYVNFDDDEIVKYSDMINLLCQKGVLKDLEIDNANAYLYCGGFKGFYDWLVAQSNKGIENNINYSSEYTELCQFFETRLRAMFRVQPANEIEVQNAIENMFICKGWQKGKEYDRESGKLMFSGKEYIPDFIIPKLNLCIEVKLLKNGRKSKVIEEINADITAYSKEYSRQMFIVYDLGVIRDELEFKQDIENAGNDIKVIIVKH